MAADSPTLREIAAFTPTFRAYVAIVGPQRATSDPNSSVYAIALPMRVITAKADGATDGVDPVSPVSMHA